MGLGGLSIGHLLVVLVIILLVFGTKKLKNIGADLGDAVKGFRSAMSAGEREEESQEPKQIEQEAARRVAGADPAASRSAAGADAGHPGGADRPRS